MMNHQHLAKPAERIKPQPIHCTGNDLADVITEVEARGGRVEAMDTGVGGNAGYALEVFQRSESDHAVLQSVSGPKPNRLINQ